MADGQNVVPEGVKDLRQLSQIQDLLNNTISSWKGDVDKKIEENRILRKANADVLGLREKGALKPDETYVAMRMIDTAIAQKQPEKVAYLVQGRRLAIHAPADANLLPSIAFREDEFTRVLKYEGWEEDFLKWIDAADLHGWAWMRCEFDISKPGFVRNRFVSTENLFFDRRCKNIQDSYIVMQRHPLTMVILDALVAQNPSFDAQAIDDIRRLVSAQKQGASSNVENVSLYEVMFKQDGMVWRAWYHEKATKWVSEPTPFYNGVDEQQTTMQMAPGTLSATPVTSWAHVNETEYPFICLRDRILEDEQLSEVEGQVQKDYYKQDAACRLWSAFINGCSRASKVMAAPKNPNPDQGGQAPKQTDMIIKDGAIWDSPMDFFTTPWPNPILPQAIEGMQTQAGVENSQVAWAVQNRNDSRKTATENMLAQQKSSSMSGVSTLMLSISVTALFNANWRIIQSQAAQQMFLFCAVDGRNNLQLIQAKCSIRAAGDVDFVQRTEMVQLMQQDWPIFSTTVLKDEFLRMYTQLRYPTYAQRFMRILDSQTAQATQLLQSLSVLLQQAVTGPDGQLLPEWAAHAKELQQIQQQVQQTLGAQNNGQQGNIAPATAGAAQGAANTTAQQGISPETGTGSMVAASANNGIAGGIKSQQG